jgi:hypothetical protein
MRFTLAALIVVGFPVVVAAQSRTDRSTELVPRPTIGLPLPPIGLPLPQIGLPLPPIGLSSAASTPVPMTTPSRSGAGRSRRSGRTVIYFVPSAGWGYPAASGLPGTPSAPPQDKRPSGRVRLELQPGVDPQIYVDGYFVGTLYDVNGELTLDAGLHKVELRADGYEALELNIRVSPDRPITYRGALKGVNNRPAPVPEVPAPAEISPPPPVPSTIYMIPGCYVGNVPPAEAGLPAGCDQRRAIAFEPRP